MRDITPHGLSPFSLNPAFRSFPPYSLTLIKLRKSHLGNSSKLDCPRFGVGSPFSLVLHRFKHLLRMCLGVDLLGGKDVGDSARFVGNEGGAEGAHVLASAH